MKSFNKIISIAVAVFLCITALAGCGQKTSSSAVNSSSGAVSSGLNSSSSISDNGKKINVVATIFPQYDFLRQIAGDKINLKMMLTPGAESHTFEPTPQDIKEINKADMFVYVGGDSDEWVDSILDSVDKSKMKVVTLMDCVDLVPEEVVEGMTPEKEDSSEENKDSVEYDEHVWTSPKNAMRIVQKLSDALCEIDPKNAQFYKQNTSEYLKKLGNLDQEFKDVVSNGKRKEIVVGDRFPFRYFVDEYGLTYYAAFPGCSADSEPSAATIAFLTDKVKQDKIPVVFHIELSNEKVCNSICEATGAKSELLNAIHNVSKKDFQNGVTYLDLMEHNVEVLKEALN
jgi:zinc transport system substrate-binding protein